MVAETQQPPEGFTPFPKQSPFMERTGPYYVKGAGHDLSVGVFVNEYSVNHGGIAHGGFLATLADAALGYAFITLTDPPTGALTLSMNMDYTGIARVGDWIESRVELHKPDGRIKFANAYFMCNGKSIARASAVYAATELNRPPRD